MGQQRGGSPVTGRETTAGRETTGSRACVARAAAGAAVISTAVIAGLAGCGSSAGSASGSSTPASSASTASGAAAATPSGTAAATTSASAAAASFTPIVEPFDPGHPARTKSAPGSCGGQQSTLAIEQCYEARTEDADTSIDAVQLASYQSGSAARRTAINAGDSARLDGLKGTTPAEAVLKSTDNTDPSTLSWSTTPEGTRIAMTDTQGDTTGAVIMSWVVIGGADGFVVNPAQFTYVDRSFTDPGKIQAPNPSGHRVSPGAGYQFGIDYSHLSADPYSGKRTGGWVYAPGSPVAVWR